LPSNQEVTTVVTKNWEPLVLGPAFAMERRPGLECLSWKFSSRSPPIKIDTAIEIGRSVLTSEAFTVDALAASAVVPGEVTALKHELRDDAMEARSSVAVTVLASGELTEVASGFGHNIVVKLEDDAAKGLTVDGDVELEKKGVIYYAASRLG
jgi:hypothetical protein